MIGSNPYREAIDAFGLQHQVDKCIEEMSELTKELLKNRDGEKNLDHIAEEIADVLITVHQMVAGFDVYFEVDEYIARKLQRLKRRINGEEIEIEHVGYDSHQLGREK